MGLYNGEETLSSVFRTDKDFITYSTISFHKHTTVLYLCHIHVLRQQSLHWRFSAPSQRDQFLGPVLIVGQLLFLLIHHHSDVSPWRISRTGPFPQSFQ